MELAAIWREIVDRKTEDLQNNQTSGWSGQGDKTKGKRGKGKSKGKGKQHGKKGKKGFHDMEGHEDKQKTQTGQVGITLTT